MNYNLVFGRVVSGIISGLVTSELTSVFLISVVEFVVS